MNKPSIFQNRFYDIDSGKPLSVIRTQNYDVFQVADSFYLSDFDINGHTQPCNLEITHVLHGSIFCSADEKSLRIEKGEGYISLPRDIHSLHAKNSCRFQTLALSVHEGSPSKILLADIEKRYAAPTQRKYKISGVAGLLSSIVSEFNGAPDEYFKQALDGAITSLLCLLARGQTLAREFKPYENKELLSEVLRYIDERFLQITSLFELSEQFGYSYNYLCALFKKLHGTTLREYLLSKKLDYAKELLSSGKKVWEISETIGYSSPYNFSRAFKKYHGVSPENFAKK